MIKKTIFSVKSNNIFCPLVYLCLYYILYILLVTLYHTICLEIETPPEV